MDDPGTMCFVEGVGDLNGDLQRLIHLDRPSGDLLVQRLAFEVLRDEVIGSVLVADIVERAGVGVGEGRNRFGFALEPRLEFGISRRQDLDRNGAIESRVASFVDLAEPARSEWREDVVWAEASQTERSFSRNEVRQFFVPVLHRDEACRRGSGLCARLDHQESSAIR
jgi:hypothetical protein